MKQTNKLYNSILQSFDWWEIDDQSKKELKTAIKNNDKKYLQSVLNYFEEKNTEQQTQQNNYIITKLKNVIDAQIVNLYLFKWKWQKITLEQAKKIIYNYSTFVLYSIEPENYIKLKKDIEQMQQGNINKITYKDNYIKKRFLSIRKCKQC